MPRRLPSRTPPVAARRRPTNPGRGGWRWSPGPAGGSGAGMAARFAERGLALGLCARTTPRVPAGAEEHTLVASVDVTDETAVEDFPARSSISAASTCG